MSDFTSRPTGLLACMGLLAASGLMACDEEPVALVDYRPRCVGFVFQYFDVSWNGPGWSLTGPVRPSELPEYVDIEVGGCDAGLFPPVTLHSVELRSVPSPDAPTEEPTALDFLVVPEVDLPVLVQEPGEHAPKDSVPGLTIRIPRKELESIASHQAVLEVTTNAAEAESTSHPGLEVCNQDPATGRTNTWCGVSERPTPDDGQFVTRIEVQLTVDRSEEER